jgi:hypothetical protein
MHNSRNHTGSVENLAEMAAVGLGLPGNTFKDAGKYGSAILFIV